MLGINLNHCFSSNINVYWYLLPEVVDGEGDDDGRPEHRHAAREEGRAELTAVGDGRQGRVVGEAEGQLHRGGRGRGVRRGGSGGGGEHVHMWA